MSLFKFTLSLSSKSMLSCPVGADRLIIMDPKTAKDYAGRMQAFVDKHRITHYYSIECVRLVALLHDMCLCWLMLAFITTFKDLIVQPASLSELHVIF